MAYDEAHGELQSVVIGADEDRPCSPYGRLSEKFRCSCGKNVCLCECVVYCECGERVSKWSWQMFNGESVCACANRTDTLHSWDFLRLERWVVLGRGADGTRSVASRAPAHNLHVTELHGVEQAPPDGEVDYRHGKLSL